MQQFDIVFRLLDDQKKTYFTRVRYQLLDTPLAREWGSLMREIGCSHVGASSIYHETRIAQAWKSVLECFKTVNEEHLLDEWFHLPRELPEDYQPLLNQIRSRCQIYEEYCRQHDITNPTRVAMRKASNMISINLEYVLEARRTGFTNGAFWFRWNQTLEVPEDARTNAIGLGDIAITHPFVSRTLAEARRANDVDVVKRKMLRSWGPTSAVGVIAFSNLSDGAKENERWIAQENLTLDTSKYSKMYAPVATMVTNFDDIDLAELLKGFVHGIEFL
jgi:hypothetical protein